MTKFVEDLIAPSYRDHFVDGIRCPALCRAAVFLAVSSFRHDFEPGLYYLFKDSELVYIGISTKSIYSRVKDHLRDSSKPFDYCTFLHTKELPDVDLLSTERELIKKFRPIYNITHNK